jgi:hypothetical protein
MPFDRDASAADALLTDLYLDAILAGLSLHGDIVTANGSVTQAAPGRLDPAIRAVSERLRRDLVRVHPSFRFEERLATRLAEAAVLIRMPRAVGAEDHVVAFRPSSSRAAPDRERVAETLTVDGIVGDATSFDRRDRARPLLIGGALTSAALSLAGAALVAWRRTRPASPMSRAARAVRDARDSAVATARVPIGSRRLD